MQARFFQRLIKAARERGWISPLVQQKVVYLFDHGLHPEQVCVGTRVMSLEQYAELLSESSQLPFTRVKEWKMEGATEIFSRDVLEQERVLPLGMQGAVLSVGFADPFHDLFSHMQEQLAERGLRLDPWVILESDRRRFYREESEQPRLEEVLRSLESLLVEHQPLHVSLACGRESLECSFDEPTITESMWSLPAWMSPGLRNRLGRWAEASGWRTELESSSDGWIFHLTRKHSVESAQHPLIWSLAVDNFLKNPQGVLVVQEPDRYLEWQLRSLSQTLIDSREEGIDSTKPVLIEIGGRDAHETMQHLALAGIPVIAVSHGTRSTELGALEAISSHLTIAKAVCTPHGRAWEVERRG